MMVLEMMSFKYLEIRSLVKSKGGVRRKTTQMCVYFSALLRVNLVFLNFD